MVHDKVSISPSDITRSLRDFVNTGAHIKESSGGTRMQKKT